MFVLPKKKSGSMRKKTMEHACNVHEMKKRTKKMLDRLPPSLQQHILLEWVSPESVFILAGGSAAVRQCIFDSASSASASYRAADGEVLSDPCIDWFRENGVPLRLWMEKRETSPIMLHGYLIPGTTQYFANGKKHRDNDLPAIVHSDGSQKWYQDGECHRDGDLPACVEADGTQEWYQNGECHRDDDLPAVVYAAGHRVWYQRGQMHRLGNPAYLREDGGQIWCVHGRWLFFHSAVYALWSTVTKRSWRPCLFFLETFFS